MPLITRFDPWRSPFCTCPPKLTLNPYTGCDHHCTYCYAQTYIPNFHDARPKKDLLTRLEKEAAKLKGETMSISNSSDPYPPAEAQTRLTRRCLQILAEHDCRIQIITKSNLVTRDIDLLARIPSMVAITITTLDEALAKRIEPDAPLPTERLKAAQSLTGKGLPVSVRIDPIIPYLNDKTESLVNTLASIGIKHVTCSTLKIRPLIWKKLSKALPETTRKLEPLYSNGDRIGGYAYLPRDFRLKLLKTVRDQCQKNGLLFGTCREGLSQLNTAVCDGSWMLDRKP